MTLAGFRQIMAETTVIFLCDKDGATIVTALNDMLGMSRQDITRQTGHRPPPCGVVVRMLNVSGSVIILNTGLL